MGGEHRIQDRPMSETKRPTHVSKLDLLDRELEAEHQANINPFTVDAAALRRTRSTAKITMISTTMEQYNKFQLICAVARVDKVEYAAIYDKNTRKGYVVEVERVKGQIKGFRDLDSVFSDEEFQVLSDFFAANDVYDINKINTWYWNTVETPELVKNPTLSQIKHIHASRVKEGKLSDRPDLQKIQKKIHKNEVR